MPARSRRRILIAAAVVALAVVLAVAAIIYAGEYPVCNVPGVLAARQTILGDDEEAARRHFYENHPNEKPLNWTIARTAVEYHERRPMGKFTLHQNDCSDFTDCIVDEALGYKAREARGSDRHIAMTNRLLWDVIVWDGAERLLPGDVVSVRHSPWYAPNPRSCGHVGIIGSDGMVYDWTKLIAWDSPRYGRNTVEWFTKNSPTPGNVWVWRLRPRYRYMLDPLPAAGDVTPAWKGTQCHPTSAATDANRTDQSWTVPASVTQDGYGRARASTPVCRPRSSGWARGPTTSA